MKANSISIRVENERPAPTSLRHYDNLDDKTRIRIRSRAFAWAAARLRDAEANGTPVYDIGDYVAREIEQAFMDYERTGVEPLPVTESRH